VIAVVTVNRDLLEPFAVCIRLVLQPPDFIGAGNELFRELLNIGA
jgi:hypothetical protein